MAVAMEDPDLGCGPDPDDDLSLTEGSDDDSESILSDDSVLPDYEQEELAGGPINTLYQACARNAAASLRHILERGVTREEVMELDINGRNGLMLAVSKGFVDIVSGLHMCPFIDINHQDNEGNTALMIAAQAGFVTIQNYILNYYPGVDIELMDIRGFTALIKASMQGNCDCVASLIMAGADINAVDARRGKDAKDWAIKTGRFETFCRMRRLNAKPCAEQFCESYVLEWPELKELVARAAGAKSASQKVIHRIKSTFSFSFPRDPQDNGALDHMVRMTTSIHSPLVATGCRPLCPTSPPEIGKRRLAVPELAQRYPAKELEEGKVSHSIGSAASASASTSASATSISSISLASCCSNGEHRGSVISNGVNKFVPRGMSHRNSVFPAGCIPQIKVTKSGDPTPKKEKKRTMAKGYLQPPVWKYKEAKLERKKEKQRLEEEKDKNEEKQKDIKKKAKKKKKKK